MSVYKPRDHIACSWCGAEEPEAEAEGLFPRPKRLIWLRCAAPGVCGKVYYACRTTCADKALRMIGNHEAVYHDGDKTRTDV